MVTNENIGHYCGVSKSSISKALGNDLEGVSISILKKIDAGIKRYENMRGDEAKRKRQRQFLTQMQDLFAAVESGFEVHLDHHSRQVIIATLAWREWCEKIESND